VRLAVAVQDTGHNAEPLVPLADAVLMRARRMRGLGIDAHARVARVEAGVLWLASPRWRLIAGCQRGRLQPRRRCRLPRPQIRLTANNVLAIGIVATDGRLVRAGHEREPRLFWALGTVRSRPGHTRSQPSHRSHSSCSPNDTPPLPEGPAGGRAAPAQARQDEPAGAALAGATAFLAFYWRSSAPRLPSKMISMSKPGVVTARYDLGLLRPRPGGPWPNGCRSRSLPRQPSSSPGLCWRMPRRVGKLLGAGLAGIYSARLGRDWWVLYEIDDAPSAELSSSSLTSATSSSRWPERSSTGRQASLRCASRLVRSWRVGLLPAPFGVEHVLVEQLGGGWWARRSRATHLHAHKDQAVVSG
jgi:hypothetical protein